MIDNILKEVRKSMWEEDTIIEGMGFGGMHESDLEWIVSNALWRENNKSITLKVSKDLDDYHLNINIEKIEKL